MDSKEFLEVCLEVVKTTRLRGFVFDGLHCDGTCDNLRCFLFLGENFVSSETLSIINDFELHYDIYRADSFTDFPVPSYARLVVSVLHPSYMPF